MIAVAWNNGKHHRSGAGYGLKLQTRDRDRYFHREWKTVFLELQGYPQPVEINIDKPSFWGPTCKELIHKQIGLWLMENSLAPWPKGKPPKLILRPMFEPRHFRLSKDE
jgi:hypothetical protein